MKILIKGYYGFGNLGDDILMVTTYQLLKQKFPHAQFFIFSNFNNNLPGFKRGNNYNHYIYNLLSKDVELIDWTYKGKFDLLVDGGGGVYFDYSRGALIQGGINFCLKVLGARRLYRVESLIRKLLNKPRNIYAHKRVGFGLGIGPYVVHSKFLYRHLVDIGGSDVLFVRDSTSLNYLSSFNFSGTSKLCADIAFLSDRWWSGTIQKQKEKSFRGHIGIILLDWHEGNGLRFETFRKFADGLNKNGMHVTFFSLDENHDVKYIETFQNNFNFVTWNPNSNSFLDFLNILSAQDILFTARAHGAILGAMLGVPSVCLATSPKLVEVSKLLPQSSVVVKEPFKEEELLIYLENIRTNYSHYIASVTKDALVNNELAKSSWQDFLQYL